MADGSSGSKVLPREKISANRVSKLTAEPQPETDKGGTGNITASAIMSEVFGPLDPANQVVMEEGIIHRYVRDMHARERIRNHITSFPVVPSHYCRRDMSEQYLASDLNLEKMYSLYIAECDAVSPRVKPEKVWLYRQIFNTEFNLSVHSPRKDEFVSCFRFRNLASEKQDEQQDIQNENLKCMLSARNLKNRIKDLAKNAHCHLLEFDLEAVRYYTCGQNRNNKMCTMLLYGVKTVNIPTIDHCFFELGIPKWSATLFMITLRKHRKMSTFMTHQMDQEEFLVFKTVQKELLKNKQVDSNGNNILWFRKFIFSIGKVTYCTYTSNMTVMKISRALQPRGDLEHP
ncbi:hypothetical protein PR048_005224 [Dryococelus australis]|uniref:Uncharacterized protein n=1 Tax=Dryococelus australis TaxID=614101 RepID=A0ABQ9I9R1_9NEOP|nr:hypothetical protein PR048_005224 [Dryococelus australis]